MKPTLKYAAAFLAAFFTALGAAAELNSPRSYLIAIGAGFGAIHLYRSDPPSRRIKGHGDAARGS